MKKDDAQFDLWAKELAPTPALRNWFGHEEPKFQEFRTCYRAELGRKQDLLRELRDKAGGQTMTLLFAASNPTCNHAVVLQEFLSEA